MKYGFQPVGQNSELVRQVALQHDAIPAMNAKTISLKGSPRAA
jgi:hypothetical protein